MDEKTSALSENEVGMLGSVRERPALAGRRRVLTGIRPSAQPRWRSISCRQYAHESMGIPRKAYVRYSPLRCRAGQ
ncbi:hypothetical protein PENSPDRAFT_465228 [Peniophora sp. CONT]|nr:hypothetical protein PENSPDRAFT_465228 [Peniophora sp. CONT]